MRKLNVKLLVILVAGGVVLGIGVQALYSFQVDRLSADLLRQADRARDEKARGREMDYLEEYLAFQPGDSEALVRYGLLLEQTAQSSYGRARALWTLTRALQAQPDRTDLRRQCVRLAMEQGQFTRAREHLDILRNKFPGDAELEVLTGQCEEANRHYEEAADWFQKSVRDAPGKPKGYLRLASLYRNRLAWPQKADEIMDSLVAANGQSPQAFLIRARYRKEFKTLEEAARDVLEARSLAPRDPAGLLLAAEVAWGRGSLDEAQECMEKVMTLPEAPGSGWAFLARIRLAQNLRLPPRLQDWRRVDQALTRAGQTTPEAVEVPILRAEMLVAQGQPDQAREVLEKARDRRPMQIELWLLLAELAENQGESGKATRLLEEAKKVVGDRAELRLARLALATRGSKADARAVLTALERDVANYPTADQPRLLAGLADAYTRLGEPAQALRVGGRLAGCYPKNLAVRFQLFELALQTGQDPLIRQVLVDIKIVEGDEGVLWRYAEAARLVRQAAGKPSKQLGLARANLVRVAQSWPGWSRLPLLEAQIDELEGYPDQAIAHYQRALALGDRQPAVVLRLVQLLYRRGRYFDAGQALARMQEVSLLPGNPGPVSEEADAGAGKGEGAAAPFSGGPGEPTPEGLLTVFDLPHQLRLARGAVMDQPGDYRNHLRLGLCLWAAGRYEKAEASFRQAVHLAGTVPDSWVTLVHYLARTGQQPKAEAVLQEAAARLAGVQRKLMVAGGGLAGAAPLPDWLVASPEALAIAQCQEVLGHQNQAEAIYRSARAADPEAIPALRAAAAHYLRWGRPEKAERIFGKIIASGRDTPGGDVAWARRGLAAALVAGEAEFARFEEAVKLLKQNIIAAGATAEDQRAMARVLATRTAFQGEAISAYEQVLAGQPLPPGDRFLLARLYEARGDWPGAREQLLILLVSEMDNPFYEAQYARGLLRRGEAARGRFWVGRLEKGYPQAFQTLELKARLLQAQGKGAEAAQLLQAFVRGKEPEVTGSFALLLEELGRRAAEEMYRTYAAEAKSPEALFGLIKFLARRGRRAEALLLCDRAWKTCPPEGAAAVSVEVLSAGAAGDEQWEGAAARVQAALRKNPQSLSLPFYLVRIREMQGRYPEAVTLYRQVVDRDDRSVQALNNLAWLWAFRGSRRAEALDLINRALAVAGPEAILLDTRGVIFLARNQPARAVEDLERVVQQAPSPSRYFHLARAYWEAKLPVPALSAWRQAQQLGLKVEHLHPLEQQSYQLLLAQLDRK